MRSLKDRLGPISDTLLERLVPRASASAVVCTWRRCCVTMGARPVSGWQKWDEQHDTRCGPCETNGGYC